jgi:hypothetical protein
MRMAIWHAGNTISKILSGSLAADILTNMDDVLGVLSVNTNRLRLFCLRYFASS